MELNELLEHLDSCKPLIGEAEANKLLRHCANEAMRVTAELNASYHEFAEIRNLFSRLIGKDVDESFCLFPPFYADFGKNITVGKTCSSTPAVAFKTRAAL
jgi:hypothetical protein